MTQLRPHGMAMNVRFDDWSERMAYFTGTYYDTEGLELLEALVAPGDTFIDVGANVGFVSLAASALVGASGNVQACEPNPILQQRLKDLFTANQVRNVTIHPLALGRTNGTAFLDADGHEGTGNLRETAGSAKVPVAVRRGDEVLSLPTSPCMVKVDVEGFEYEVLAGMLQFLESPSLAAYVEVTPTWLHDRGASAEMLFAIFEERGFRAALPRRRRRDGKLLLTWLDRPLQGVHQYDVVFLRPDEVFESRVHKSFQVT